MLGTVALLKIWSFRTDGGPSVRARLLLAPVGGKPGGEPQAAAFEFERVTVVRGGRRVLDELDGRIPAAGITVISGPSGAGKTTLLRLCNRLDGR
jgi:ABC-type multidrug transport system fused ATPase/permease subunit